MRRHEDDLEALRLKVVAVTFEGREAAQRYVRETDLRWPLLLDPARSLYAAYGMGRAGWRALWGPATWRAYARLLWKGHRVRRPSGDVHQRGGDVLIDPVGMVVLAHVGSGPADRPAVSALLGPVRRAASGPAS